MAQLQSTSITGSLIVTQGITGSISGSTTNAISASYALTASYALNAGDSIWTGSAGNIYYSGGNVGIGTASPTEKLDVRGNLYAEGTNNHATFKATGGSYSYLELHDGSSYGYLIKNISAGTGNGALPGALYTYTDNSKAFQHIHAGSPLFTIQSDGNVGIGVTNPAYKLHVENNLNGGLLQTLRNTNTGTSQYIEFKIGTSDSSELRLGSSYNYAASEWNQTWIYAVNRNLALKTSAGFDIRFYAGGTDDSYERMRVTNGGNVGIGTTSPLATLQITGLAANSGSSSANNPSGTLLLATDSGFNAQSYGSSLVFSQRWFSGLSNQVAVGQITGVKIGGDGTFGGGLAFWTSNTTTNSLVERVRITDNGNVGIGVTNPAERLQVQTSIRVEGSTPAYNLYESTTQRGNLQWQTTSNYVGVRLFNLDNSNLMFGTNNTERMRIDTNGNVGIGTTSPGYKLEVNGGSAGSNIARFTTGAAGGGTRGLTVNSDTSQVRLQVTDNVGNYGTWAFLNLNPDGGYVGIGTTNPQYLLDLGTAGSDNQLRARRIYANGTGTNSGVTFDSTLIYQDASGTFNITNPGSYPNVAFTINNSGNVGIGTTSPGQKLQVEGSLLVNTGTSAAAYRDIMLGGIGGWSTGESHGIDTVYGSAGSPTTFSRIESHFDGTNGKIRFRNLFRASAPRTDILMTIQGDGNVGIGTDSPSNKLEVIGNIYTPNSIYLGSSGTYSKLGFYRYDGSAVGAMGWHTDDKFYIGGFPGWGATAGNEVRVYGFGANLYLGSTTAGDVVTVNTSGNVGIGTGSPASTLHVYNNADVWHTRIGGASGELRIGGQTASGAVIQALEPGGAIRQLYLQRDGGNVGIGTSSPTATLQINGAGGDTAPTLRLISAASDVFNWASSTQHANLTAGETSIHLIGKANSQYNQAYFGYRHVSDGSSSNMVTIGMYASDYLLNILGNGNVGIGTTSPGALLHVSQPSAATVLRIGNNSNYDQSIYFNGGNDWSMGMDYSNSNAFVLSNYSSVGTNDRIVVTTGGNVSIGNSSPTTKLTLDNSPNPKTNHIDMVGYSSTAKGHLGQFSDAQYLTSNWYYDGGQYYDTVSLGQAAIIVQAGATTTSYIDFALSDAGSSSPGIKMRINANGNVGIGTTNPGAKLNIVESTSGYDQVAIFTGTGQYGSSIHLNATGTAGSNWRILSTANGSTPGGGHFGLYNDAAGLYRLVINPSGNVGIGTTSPTQKLEVNGNTWVSGTVYINRGVNSTEGYTYFDHPGTQVWKQGIFSDNTSTFSIGNGGGFTRLFNITNAGNVGIGTTSPASRLEVGNFLDAFTNSITVSGRYEYVPQFTFRLGQSGTNYDWTGGVISCGDDGNYNGIIYFKTANAGRDTPTTKMVIKANGNVGIGTTSPSQKLDVNGYIVSDRYYPKSSNNTYIYGNSGGLVIEGSGYFYVPTSGGSYFEGLARFRGGIYNDGNTYLQINGGTSGHTYLTGNVGIGTTNPSRKFVVTTAANDEWIATFTNTGTGPYGVYIDTANNSGTAYSFATYTNAGTGFFVRNNGSVGIGTTSPGTNLQVNGGADTNIRVVSSAGGYAAIQFGDTSDTVRGAVSYNSGDNSISIRGYDNADRLFINSAGNVGIGVTSPAAKLQVSGSSNVLNVRGSGSATTSSIFSVDGNNGRLFEVSDDLSNSLFSVNTIAGLPVIEAFADYTVTMGTYGAYTLQVTGSRVGVGTSSPGYPLHVSGSVSGISIYATNDIAAFSDQSVKTDLQVIDSAVDRIKQINGYTYVRVDDLSNTRRAGVIAQEVQKVLPEVVSENNDGTLNVAYSNMIALLIEGMKEQQSQIDELKQRLDNL